MDKIFSARIDESISGLIEILAQRLHTSKKDIIESAVRAYSEQVSKHQNIDILDQTFGTWDRKESTTETVKAARKAFQSSMMRHQK